MSEILPSADPEKARHPADGRAPNAEHVLLYAKIAGLTHTGAGQDGSTHFFYRPPERKGVAAIPLRAMLDAKGEVIHLTMRSRSVDYVPALTADNLSIALQVLYTQTQFNGLPADVKVRSLGAGRLEWTTAVDGKSEDFVLIDNKIWKVLGIHQCTENERHQLESWKKELKELQDKDPNVHIGPDLHPYPVRLQLSSDALQWHNRARELYENIELMKARDGARILGTMDGSATRVFEKTNPLRPGTYTLLFEFATGEVGRSLIDVINDRIGSTYEELSDGNTRRTREYGSRPQLRERDIRTGKETFQEWNANGTISAEGTDDAMMVNDQDGKPMYRVTYSQNRVEKRFMLPDPERGGEFFDPRSETLASLKRKIRTKTQYYVFKEVADKYGCDQNPLSEEIVKGMREHGKEICGVSPLVQQLAEITGKIIDVDNVPKGTKFYQVDIQLLERRLPILLGELQKYPPGLIKRMSLKIIYVVGGSDGTSAFEQASGYSKANDYVIASVSQENFQSIVHHEFGHQVDQTLNTINNTDDQTQWWGSGRKITAAEGAIQNFARSYGRTNDAEDVATICEALFERRKALELGIAARDNPVLQAKITEVKRRYYALSDGRMDTIFWQDVERGETINNAYWQKREAFVKNESAEALRADFAIIENLNRKLKELVEAEGDSVFEKCREARVHALCQLSTDRNHEIARAIWNSLSYDQNGKKYPEQVIGSLGVVFTKAPHNLPMWAFSELVNAYQAQNDTGRAIAVLEAGQKMMPGAQWIKDKLQVLRAKP